MEIEIHNVAKVREVKIRIDRITVVAGPNGSGKSTIAKGLLTLRDTIHSLSYYVAYKKARDLLKTFFGARARRREALPEFPFADLLHFLSWGMRAIRRPEVLCSRAFWENDEDVFDYFSAYQASRQEESPREAWEQYIAQGAYETLKSRILDWLQKPEHSDEAYGSFVIENAFKRTYCNREGAFGFEPETTFALREANGGATVRFENGKYVPSETQGTIDSDTYYLEPFHILDEIEPGPYSERDFVFRRRGAHYGETCTPSWGEFVASVRESDPTLEEANAQEVRNALLGTMSQTIGGQLTQQNNLLVFKERSISAPIQIPNVASGIKSMALIARAIENGWIRERDLLIIDEPESNLHPEWQIRFAEWLVDLSDKLGLRILLNTHSPYFLRALECFCGRETTIGKLHVYLMTQDVAEDGEGGTVAAPTFFAQDVTDDIAQVYKTMAKPFEEVE